MITDKEIDILASQVGERLSASRFSHTLGVMRAAELLCGYCLPEKRNELRAAALLHDIAKELSVEEQQRIIIDGGGTVSAEDVLSTPVLHSFAAPYVIMADFNDFATEDILRAVKFHTVGDAEMSIFDEIVFLADFIEDTREYAACISLRNEILPALKEGNIKENQQLLHRAALKMTDFTIEYLNKRQRHIHSAMFAAKKMLEDKLMAN